VALLPDVVIPRQGVAVAPLPGAVVLLPGAVAPLPGAEVLLPDVVVLLRGGAVHRCDVIPPTGAAGEIIRDRLPIAEASAVEIAIAVVRVETTGARLQKRILGAVADRHAAATTTGDAIGRRHQEIATTDAAGRLRSAGMRVATCGVTIHADRRRRATMMIAAPAVLLPPVLRPAKRMTAGPRSSVKE
jgi:hypothetical protein